MYVCLWCTFLPFIQVLVTVSAQVCLQGPAPLMALARAGIAGGFTASVFQSLLRLTRLAEHQGPIVHQDWACSCEPDAALQRLAEELKFLLLGVPSDKSILLVTFVAGVTTGVLFIGLFWCCLPRRTRTHHPRHRRQLAGYTVQ